MWVLLINVDKVESRFLQFLRLFTSFLWLSKDNKMKFEEFVTFNVKMNPRNRHKKIKNILRLKLLFNTLLMSLM